MNIRQGKYAVRRDAFIVELGGVCVNCGTDQRLQFDHIDPETSEVRKPADAIRDWSLARARSEVIDKCQLLCIVCHGVKTAADQKRKRLPIAARE